MKSILILEDEAVAQSMLQAAIAQADSSAVFDIKIAGTFEKAIELISDQYFDCVFVDLLLLPPGHHIDHGQVVCEDPLSSETFSPEHWDKYVLQKGGIEFLRRFHQIYDASDQPEPPMAIITSYFDTLPGYARTVRAVQSYATTILLPKFYKNPSYEDFSAVPEVSDLARVALQHILNRNITDAQTYASKLREKIFEFRCKRLDAQMHKITDEAAQKRLRDIYFILNYSFRLVVSFDPRGDTELDWLCAAKSEFYPFSLFYEDWLVLRDSILLNPKVQVKFWLEASNIRQNGEERIPLYSISQPAWGDNNIAVNKVRAALRYRALLTYLAFIAEPPQGLLDYGWTVSQEHLQQGCMQEIEKNALVRKEDGQYILDWPTSNSDIDIERFVEMRDGKGSMTGYISELRDKLLSDINAYYKTRLPEVPFATKHIIASRISRSGYFFNGDLELKLLDPDSGKPFAPSDQLNPDCHKARVFLFPMADSQLFECVNGKLIQCEDLVERLTGQFNEVKVISDVEELASVPRKRNDVLVCAPIDADGLYWWNAEINRENSATRDMIASGLRVILVPDTASAQDIDADIFKNLADNDVHCIYTKGYSKSIPEVKLIDAILCTGPRVKYKGFPVPNPDFTTRWRKAVTQSIHRFQNAYETLYNSGVLGDHASGASSVRIDSKRFLVTSSITDKRKVEKDDLALAISYSPTYNELRWSGERRPSSSSPWHAYLYAHRKDINAILHTHNKVVTYCPKLSHLRTQQYSGYGTPELGRQLARILNSKEARMSSGASVAILEGHGEVAVGSDLGACAQALIELHNRVLDE